MSPVGSGETWARLARAIVEHNSRGSAIPNEIGDQFATEVRAVCRDRIPSRRLPQDDIEELTQHIVVKTWQALPRFRGEHGGASLRSLVETAIANSLKTYLAKARGQAVPASQIVRQMGEDEDILDPGEHQAADPSVHGSSSAEQRAASRALGTHLRAVLARIPTTQRRAFKLHHIAGLSFRQAGRVLGISEEAAKMASSRASQHLRRALARYEEGL